jgi:hypothetical protein
MRFFGLAIRCLVAAGSNPRKIAKAGDIAKAGEIAKARENSKGFG